MIRLITTADGSHSLYDDVMDETYHSTHGAIQESIHVFIDTGLKYFAEHNPSDDIAILEVGFGTGLNAILSLAEQRKSGRTITYTTVESNPLPSALVSQLNYPEIIGDSFLKDAFVKMHGATWNEALYLAPGFSINKVLSKVQEVQFKQEAYDIIYFDAFAPSKQPDLWNINLLKSIVGSMKPQGIFVTYSAKGQLRRDLTTLGTQVELLKGAPGKAQMIRAIKGK